MNSTLFDLCKVLLEQLSTRREASGKTRLPGGSDDQRRSLLEQLRRQFQACADDPAPSEDIWIAIELTAKSDLARMKAAEAALSSPAPGPAVPIEPSSPHRSR